MFPDLLDPIRRVVAETRSISASEISNVLDAASVMEPTLIAVPSVRCWMETLDPAIRLEFITSLLAVRLILPADICPPIVSRPEDAESDAEFFTTITPPEVVVKEEPVMATLPKLLVPGALPVQAEGLISEARVTVPES